MNATERENLRVSLLQQLRTVGASTLPLSTLVNGARLAGFDSANDDIVRGELVYLLDKGMVANPERAISPENKRWRISASGVDFLAEAGL